MQITEGTVRRLVSGRKAALALPVLEYSLAQAVRDQPGGQLRVGRYTLTLDARGQVGVQDERKAGARALEPDQLDLPM